MHSVVKMYSSHSSMKRTTSFNVSFLVGLMGEIRAAIAEERFAALKDEFLAHYTPTEEESRLRSAELYRRRREKETT